MNRSMGILLALALVAAVPAFAGDDAAATLQGYELTDLDGATSSLADHHGEVVVVNFWASWCAPCLKELPVLDSWNTEWAGRGARVAAISVDNSAVKAARMVEKQDLGLDVYHDGPDGLARDLDLPWLPCTYVLDQSGQVVLVTGGSSDEELARVERTVEELLSKAASAAAITSSNGGAR